MKILILANNDIGLYKFRKELIEQLNLNNHKIWIALPFGHYIPRLIELGCNFINVDIDRRGTNPTKDIRILASYIKIIKKIKPDLILTYTIKPTLYGGLVCSMMNVPYIVNITGLGTSIQQPGFLRSFTLLLYRMILKNAVCIFFQNTLNQKFFIQNNIPMGRQILLPGSGVNLSEFHILPYPDDNCMNFLFIARVMKEKGITEYLEAARIIKEKYANTMFHIVGACEENYLNTLEDYEKKGIIKYHGQQTNIKPFYKMAHCIIHPSYHEGMSNVLLEAAASGRPIIASDIAGCREIIEEDITGYKVPVKNTEYLIQTIEKFISLNNRKKKQLGLEGRKKVEREFDRNIVINKYIKEINKIEVGQNESI